MPMITTTSGTVRTIIYSGREESEDTTYNNDYDNRGGYYPFPTTYPTRPMEPAYPSNQAYPSNPAYPSYPAYPTSGRSDFSSRNINIEYDGQGGSSQQPKQIPKPSGRRGQSEPKSSNYEQIKRDLVSRRALFEDTEFPADSSTLFPNERPPIQCEWKRPHEIVSNPEFIVEGASRFDVRQGQLGDCWLLAAIASMSLHRELFERVVPVHQSFQKDYCGLFRFNFWRFGEWVEVIVDDLLPTYNGKLAFMHSTDRNEFWSALLEKAYAKMVGSYGSLRGGTQSEAMEDFTGGITEMFDLKEETPPNLFQIMSRAHTRTSLMGCSIDAEENEIEARLPNGLIKGHAYSITDVKMVTIRGRNEQVALIRIRNPWGNEEEWKGPWGDKSSEWKYISESDRKDMGLNFEDDGEFWMSYKDFVDNFEKLEICHLGPQSMTEHDLKASNKRRWEMSIENGFWKRKVTAGGCRNFPNSFWTNPQFRVTVVDADEDDDENRGTLIIGLMQKNMRKLRDQGIELYTIGYGIYKLNDISVGPLDNNFFKFNQSVAKSPSFINLREVCGRHKLQPGAYVIVPSTFEPDQEAEFLLRIFSEKPNTTEELDDETSMQEIDIPPRPTTTQDEQQIKALKQAFITVAGSEMEIDAHDLKSILDNAFAKEFSTTGFSVETSRSLLAMMDTDQSGRLGYDEFEVLWNDLRLWKTIFKKFDSDADETFSSHELRQALQSVGFHVSNSVFNSLVMRYSDKKGQIRFDDYVLLCSRLKTIFETFLAQPKTSSGEAIFDKDKFVQCIMYA